MSIPAWSYSYVVPFRRPYVRYLVGQIRAGHGQAGALLQKLALSVIRSVPGFRVAEHFRGKGGEYDILVGNSNPPGEPLRWIDDFFLVECKDTQKRVSEKELGHFLSKLNLTKTRTGIIVSKRGLSGAARKTNATRDQGLAFSEMRVVVLCLDLEDFATLGGAMDFLALLQRRYEHLRFQ